MNGGGSRSQLLECDDGHSYVVKLIGNQQGNHILANEMASYYIAKELDLPVPEAVIIDIPLELVTEINTKTRLSLRPGPAFGSHWLHQDHRIIVPGNNSDLVKQTENKSKWLGVVVFDTLIQNDDRKGEHILIGIASDQSSQFYVIDHGHTLGTLQKWGSLNINSLRIRNIYPDIQYDGRDKTFYRAKLERFNLEELMKKIERLPLNEWEVQGQEVELLGRYMKAAIPRTIELLLST
ncbi:MAG: hypothetical protein M1556_01220 [Candidatus Thermoplasmatota archaeon]|jgi:hypothetical protein|nr:hypothetical protein [Candidatus Thermoplasmatota archaeon]MCL6002255.1 hypothetical protein [Candidatus Thermoplasmatota archaeon]